MPHFFFLPNNIDDHRSNQLFQSKFNRIFEDPRPVPTRLVELLPTLLLPVEPVVSVVRPRPRATIVLTSSSTGRISCTTRLNGVIISRTSCIIGFVTECRNNCGSSSDSVSCISPASEPSCD
ncbi:hypothetical protein DERP_006873 [Dermatophagoides pteronyssinus]|uniref:Uncharacterized protein n=1 Tax=Dermatophagoides pteronyssinus TaxID=6956 RepID=A0ABQ8ISL6_DERPT|nr:hypothetical protein DERP_006873 [Dermatophagoides pteronyssinus]